MQQLSEDRRTYHRRCRELRNKLKQIPLSAFMATDLFALWRILGSEETGSPEPGDNDLNLIEDRIKK